MKLHITEQEHRAAHVHREYGFNHKFDPASCTESVSLLVEPNSTRAWLLDHAGKSGDPKGMIAHYTCCILGRAADIDRVTNVGVRLLDDNKIEIRLKFGPPWWWDQARQYLQGPDVVV